MGESKGTNFVWLSLLSGNQTRDAMNQDAGLTRPGSGQHQHRPIDVVGRLLLLRIELRKRDSHGDGALECQSALCERKAKKATGNELWIEVQMWKTVAVTQWHSSTRLCRFR